MPLVLSGSNGISSDGSNWALQPDSSGRLTLPNQPVFYANRSGYSNVTADAIVPWTPVIDVGSNYNTSTNRWTAPAAGKYLVVWANLARASSGYMNAGITKNGSYVNHMYLETGWVNMASTCIIDCAVGDYIQTWKQAGSGDIHNGIYAQLSIVKVG